MNISWKKIWHFIWEDNSPLSWVINVVIAFILIKFLVYPGLGFALGTSHPVVAVVSSSMEHNGVDFDTWWAENGGFYIERGISEEMFREFRFQNGFNKGDIMVLHGPEPQDIKEGDVIVFANQPPIIHRVVDRDYQESFLFTTKGDNNRIILPVERNIPEENVLGAAWVRVPLLGYVKIWFVQIVQAGNCVVSQGFEKTCGNWLLYGSPVR